jgi:hypothetical protein
MTLIEEGDILRNEDWSVQIIGPGTPHPAFLSTYPDLPEGLALYDRFNCKKLVLIIAPEKNQEIDLSRVSTLDAMEYLHIQCAEQVSLKLDPSTPPAYALNNLRELIISGPVPNTFHASQRLKGSGKLEFLGSRMPQIG